MFAIPEQFSAVTKANLDAQVDMFNLLASKTIESVEKVVDLNMSVMRTSLEESAAAAKQLLTVKDPQEFFASTAAQAEPNAKKALAYGRNLASIATSAQAEFSRAAETQIAEGNRKVIALVDDVAKNAPAGSENAIALLKTAVGSVNAGYEQFNKTTKQTVEAFEGNVAAAVNQFSQATEKTVTRAARK